MLILTHLFQCNLCLPPQGIEKGCIGNEWVNVVSINNSRNNSLPVPILDEEKKLSEIFIFTLLCGASEGFMKALKALNKTFKNAWRGEG